MDLKSVKIPAGSKLFKVHHFTYMVKGNAYRIEVDESNDGTFTGHGEHTTDKNNVIGSISGRTLGECLEGLIAKASSRP